MVEPWCTHGRLTRKSKKETNVPVEAMRQEAIYLVKCNIKVEKSHQKINNNNLYFFSFSLLLFQVFPLLCRAGPGCHCSVRTSRLTEKCVLSLSFCSFRNEAEEIEYVHMTQCAPPSISSVMASSISSFSRPCRLSVPHFRLAKLTSYYFAGRMQNAAPYECTYEKEYLSSAEKCGCAVRQWRRGKA